MPANPQSTLMARRRQQAADEIVRTSIAMFARDGFGATTVEAIAAEAGCSPRTFYRYFGSKEDVLFADVPSVIERLGAVIDQQLAAGAKPWAAVTEAVVAIIGRLEGHDAELAMERQRLWLEEPALYDRYVRHVTAAEAEIVAHILEQAGDDAPLMAIAAIGAYRTTVTDHHGLSRSNKRLAKHLRVRLGRFGRGFDHQ